MIREYIDEQESEQIVDDSRFLIDNPQTPRRLAEGRLVLCRADLKSHWSFVVLYRSVPSIGPIKFSDHNPESDGNE